MTGDAAFDARRGVLEHIESRSRHLCQNDAACLADAQCGLSAFSEERFFNRNLAGRQVVHESGELLRERQQAARQVDATAT